MNKYLEIIHFSFIFAPSKNKQIVKNKQIAKKQTIRDMNQLPILLTTCSVTRRNKILSSRFIVHVHWFSGFI